MDDVLPRRIFRFDDSKSGRPRRIGSELFFHESNLVNSTNYNKNNNIILRLQILSRNSERNKGTWESGSTRYHIILFFSFFKPARTFVCIISAEKKQFNVTTSPISLWSGQRENVIWDEYRRCYQFASSTRQIQNQSHAIAREGEIRVDWRHLGRCHLQQWKGPALN